MVVGVSPLSLFAMKLTHTVAAAASRTKTAIIKILRFISTGFLTAAASATFFDCSSRRAFFFFAFELICTSLVFLNQIENFYYFAAITAKSQQTNFKQLCLDKFTVKLPCLSLRIHRPLKEFLSYQRPATARRSALPCLQAHQENEICSLCEQ